MNGPRSKRGLRLSPSSDAFAAGGLEDFGRRALDVLGARMALTFLAGAVLSVPVVADVVDLAWVLLAVGAVTGCCLASYVILTRFHRAGFVAALTAFAAGVVWVIYAAPSSVHTEALVEMAGWVLVAVAGGIAASRGPMWGALAFAPVATISVTLAIGRGFGIPIGQTLGAMTFYLGASLTHVLARKGFAATERELASAEAAVTAQRVAKARWAARREADRILHDTLLSTLTVLAHRSAGLSPIAVREACARDINALQSGALAPESPLQQRSGWRHGRLGRACHGRRYPARHHHVRRRNWRRAERASERVPHPRCTG